MCDISCGGVILFPNRRPCSHGETDKKHVQFKHNNGFINLTTLSVVACHTRYFLLLKTRSWDTSTDAPRYLSLVEQNKMWLICRAKWPTSRRTVRQWEGVGLRTRAKVLSFCRFSSQGGIDPLRINRLTNEPTTAILKLTLKLQLSDQGKSFCHKRWS